MRHITLFSSILIGLGLSFAGAADGAGAGAYWVFFTDRGAITPDAETLAAAAARVSPEAWGVRATSARGAVPDERDLPLWEPYVARIGEFGRLRHRSRWLNAVSVELAGAAIDEVRAFSFVSAVRPVARAERQGLGPALGPDGRPLEVTLPARAEGPRGPYPYGASYGQLLEIDVPAVHAAGFTGNRVRMMMLDTGFRKNHAAFAQSLLLGERDYVFGDGNTQNEPADDPNQHNHGTGCWGVAGGYDPGRLVGPAYGAGFFLSKTEDVRSETQVEEDHYVAALEWADSLGVRVTSASLSYTCFDDGACYDFPLKDGDTPVISRAVDIASARGILCVNAAGNYGYEGPMSLGTPADADSVLSIGAVDSLNVIASFSSRGPSDDGRTKPEVVARGQDTWWADAEDFNTYGFASGTSLSCPLVAGTSALLAEAHPEWSNMQIRAALMNTADRAASPNNDYGWGRIDAMAAIASAPVIFPHPFDLVSPANNTMWPNLTPTFVWRRTIDPDELGVVTYRLRLQDTSPGGASWELVAGADTSYTLGFSLTPGRNYAWEVAADDPHGHRRWSRQTRLLYTPGGAAVETSAGDIAGVRLRVGPNPFRGSVRFALEGNLGREVTWSVFDPIGRRVQAGAWDGPAGREGAWDGRAADGRPVPAGVYYLEAVSGGRLARAPLVKLP